MKFLVQIDDTNPKLWQNVEADNATDAVAEAIKPLILNGPAHDPQTAYVALGSARHPNGAPICVQSYTLKVNRETP